MKWWLFRYNKITGYWEKEREVTEENAQEWEMIYEIDEPDEHFWISRRWPQHTPKKEGKIT